MASIIYGSDEVMKIYIRATISYLWVVRDEKLCVRLLIIAEVGTAAIIGGGRRDSLDDISVRARRYMLSVSGV